MDFAQSLSLSFLPIVFLFSVLSMYIAKRITSYTHDARARAHTHTRTHTHTQAVADDRVHVVNHDNTQVRPSHARVTSKLHPSHVRVTYESRRSYIRVTSELHTSHVQVTSESRPSNIRATSELRLRHAFVAHPPTDPSHRQPLTQPRPSHVIQSHPSPSSHRFLQARPHFRIRVAIRVAGASARRAVWRRPRRRPC